MPQKPTAAERLQVTLWRGVMGALALGGGKSVPGHVMTHCYGSGRPEWLDQWQPSAKTAPLPVVVHIHGGGWITGSKGRFHTSKPYHGADHGFFNFGTGSEEVSRDLIDFLARG